ncbi:hypothetical protein FB451DRAFT_1138061 [Mycena latifolia]|nr:hypothetical protein FB451DRAFT_1138061 [Mycena latifolia]
MVHEILKRAELDGTFGVLFISAVMTAGLWGAGLTQLYYYYDKCSRKDSRALKAYVGFVWVVDTVHQALLTWFAYEYVVTHYDNPAYLSHLHPALAWSVLCSGSVCYLVQLFFVRRIWQLSSHNFVLTAVLGLAASAQFGCQMAYFGKALTFTDFAGLSDILFLTKTINIITAVTDTAIALTLVYLLHSSRTGYERTESIINRLIVFCLNTGLATGASAVLVLTFSFALPDKLVYMFFYMNIARLYVNSLLAALNYRTTFKEEFSMNSGSRDAGSSNNISLGRLGNRSATGDPHLLSIQVRTETTNDLEKVKGVKGASTLSLSQSPHSPSQWA